MTPRRALLFMLVGACATPLASAPYSSDAVKAAYLFRFASYVEWPEGRAGDAPFVFGVHGDDEVTVHLERLTAGMRIRNRPAQVRVVREPAELDGVQILYVGPRVFRGSRGLRAAAAARQILVVADHEDGIANGAVVNFIEVNRNVRFEISLAAADRARLKIDSALLSVAARVEPRNQK